MEWRKDYETGIKVIDEQHMVLVDMLNKLKSPPTKEEIPKLMGQVLKGLVDYVKFHFKEEEKVMERINFPDFQKHKARHEELVKEVVNILLRVKKGENIDIEELKDFLTHWLMDHIIDEDKEIGHFLFA